MFHPFWKRWDGCFSKNHRMTDTNLETVDLSDTLGTESIIEPLQLPGTINLVLVELLIPSPSCILTKMPGSVDNPSRHGLRSLVKGYLAVTRFESVIF